MTNHFPRPRASGTAVFQSLHLLLTANLNTWHEAWGAMGKKKKRKTIPAALHSEISEYASLLRVLRTTAMLDVTAQLTRLGSPQPPWQASPVNEEEAGLRQASTLSRGDNKGASGLSDEDKDKCHPSAGRDSGMSSRNNWTRWPLLVGDIHIPEWRFEDEVLSLAKQVLLSDFPISSNLSEDSSSRFSVIDPNELHEDQVEALLPPSSLHALTDVSSSHLEGIFAALASYSPLMKSAQNRHHRHQPIGWESVLNIVGAAGLVDCK